MKDNKAIRKIAGSLADEGGEREASSLQHHEEHEPLPTQPLE
jgi:hypothetical protein